MVDELGAPVGEAIVTVSGQAHKCGADGVGFVDSSTASLRARAECEGHKAWDGDLSFEVRTDIVLVRVGSAAVHVVDEDGAPVAGATVMLGRRFAAFEELEKSRTLQASTDSNGVAAFVGLDFGWYCIHCRHPDYIYSHDAQGKLWSRRADPFSPQASASDDTQSDVRPQDKLCVSVPDGVRRIVLSSPYVVMLAIEGQIKIEDARFHGTSSWYAMPRNSDGWEALQAVRSRLVAEFPSAHVTVVTKTSQELLPKQRTISPVTGMDEGAHYRAEVHATGRATWRGHVMPVRLRDLQGPVVIPLSEMPASSAFGSIALSLPDVMEEDRKLLVDPRIGASWDRLDERGHYGWFRPISLLEHQVLPVGKYRLRARDSLVNGLGQRLGPVEVLEGEHKELALSMGAQIRWVRIVGDRDDQGSVLIRYEDDGTNLGGLVRSLSTGFEGFLRFGRASVSIRSTPDAEGVFFTGAQDLMIDRATPSVVPIPMALQPADSGASSK